MGPLSSHQRTAASVQILKETWISRFKDSFLVLLKEMAVLSKFIHLKLLKIDY